MSVLKNIKTNNFGFCPQLGCGKVADKFVEKLRKQRLQTMEKAYSTPHLIHNQKLFIHKSTFIHYLSITILHNSYTPPKTKRYPSKREVNIHNPHIPQHPLLPIPYI